MAKKRLELPTVRELDTWTKEIGGYIFAFQINLTSGGGGPTWYPVKFWKEGTTTLSTGGKFEDRPTREQVEKEFEGSVQSYIKIHLTKLDISG